jgi:hypothetical protein
MRSRVAIGVVLGCLTVMPLPPRTAAADPPCLTDIKQFCAEVPVGGGRVQECLKEHEAKISPACRTQVDVLQRDAAMLDASCRWDIGRFCSDLSPGGGRVMSCLLNNKAALSPACLNLLNTMGKN